MPGFHVAEPNPPAHDSVAVPAEPILIPQEQHSVQPQPETVPLEVD